MNKLIQDSFERCTSRGLDAETNYPRICLSDNELIPLKLQHKKLIHAFNKSCEEIVEKLKEEIYFILTDTEGILLSHGSKKEYRPFLHSLNMIEGVSFAEESLGTNSISLSIASGDSIYLMPQEHYCKAFHKWYCYCIPLRHQNRIIGFMDISTIDLVMKDEIKIIGDLLAYKVISQMDRVESPSNHSLLKFEELTNRQKELIDMLLKGLSEKEIAAKMFISISTVKYHKSKIFEAFGVKNTAQLTKKYYGL